MFDHERAALELTAKLLPACSSFTSPPPPHHCRQVAAVSELLDVGSLYKGLLCSLPPGPLDHLSHWIRWQARVALLLFPVVTPRHPEGGTSRRWYWHRKCSSLYLLLPKTTVHNVDVSRGEVGPHVRINTAATVHEKQKTAYTHTHTNKLRKWCVWLGRLSSCAWSEESWPIKTRPEIVLSSLCLLAVCLSWPQPVCPVALTPSSRASLCLGFKHLD